MITSTANSRVRQARALRQRKERDRSGLAFVEGIRPCGEVVALDAGVELLIVAPELLRSDFGRSTVGQARERGVEVIEVSRRVFESLSGRDGPQGLAAVVRQRWGRLADVQPAAGNCWVALDSAADPGNLGSILRSCDATGSPGVILLYASADPYDPTALRAATGSTFSRRLVRASFDELIAWTGEHGCCLVGTSGGGETDYREAGYGERTVLLLGSEREGLADEQLACCDTVVRIPMAGRADSLNLAVAASLLLYEVLRQRAILPAEA